MLGFSKGEIIQRANAWMVANQAWADGVVSAAALQAGPDPAARLEAASLANFRTVLPAAIAAIMEEQNILMEEQVKQLISDAVKA